MSPSSESASLPAPCSSCSSTTVSGLHKKISVLERYKLPSHWQPPSSTGPLGVMKVLLFQMLCICAYGQPRLDTMWASIKLAEEGDLDVWAECSKRTSDQQNNILVVAGLLLATSSVFITTIPPVPILLDYTRRGPYLCICAGFGLILGAIIVTSICVLVTSKISPVYASEVLFGSTEHVYLTLIIISYPTICTCAGTLFLAFGILSAIWSAGDLGFKLSAIILLVLPMNIGVLFAFASRRVRSRQKKEGVDSLQNAV